MAGVLARALSEFDRGVVGLERDDHHSRGGREAEQGCVEGDLRLDRSAFGPTRDAFPLAAAGGVPAQSLSGRPSTEEGATQ